MGIILMFNKKFLGMVIFTSCNQVVEWISDLMVRKIERLRAHFRRKEGEMKSRKPNEKY